ncbi:hypothetical protein BsWGS_22945 [Bradybaena similaris]
MSDTLNETYDYEFTVNTEVTPFPTNDNASFDDEDFVNYTIPQNVFYLIDLMSLFTALTTVFGFFTNLIAIGMLSTQTFERMSFSVLMKILCMYNIVVLFLGAVRYQSFYLDYRSHFAPHYRRYFCTYFLWFVHVFKHARTASIMLILYNRINAVDTADCFVKYVDAIRLPILGNTLFLLVSTVYVSRYIDNLDDKTELYNRTECTFAYMRPYRRHGELSADDMVSNMPVIEHGTILIMLAILLVQLIRRSRKKVSISSDSTTSPPLSQPMTRGSRNIPLRKLRTTSSIAKFSVLPAQGVMEIKDILYPVTSIHVDERDSAVLLMAVTIVILNTLISGTRDAVDSFIVNDVIQITAQDSVIFMTRTFLDLAFFTMMSTMLFVMCLTCTYFRQSAFDLLYNVSPREAHSSSSVLYASNTQLNTIAMGSLLHLDMKESLARDRRFLPQPSPEDGEDQLLTTGSVWSLDKPYFLNATRTHALIEKF